MSTHHQIRLGILALYADQVVHYAQAAEWAENNGFASAADDLKHCKERTTEEAWAFVLNSCPHKLRESDRPKWRENANVSNEREEGLEA